MGGSSQCVQSKTVQHGDRLHDAGGAGKYREAHPSLFLLLLLLLCIDIELLLSLLSCHSPRRHAAG